MAVFLDSFTSWSMKNPENATMMTRSTSYTNGSSFGSCHIKLVSSHIYNYTEITAFFNQPRKERLSQQGGLTPNTRIWEVENRVIWILNSNNLCCPKNIRKVMTMSTHEAIDIFEIRCKFILKGSVHKGIRLICFISFEKSRFKNHINGRMWHFLIGIRVNSEMLHMFPIRVPALHLT